MKKAAALLIVIFIVVSNFVTVSADDAPKISAESAVLIDAKMGTVLFEKNSTERLYPASTTKTMTALLAFEAVSKGEVSLDQPIEVKEDIIKPLPWDGSNIALKAGEVMTLGELLKGLLIASGNDAAVVIADYIGGDIDNFVMKMNEKAGQLGLIDTHFVNPNGLHDENHYTTATDLAKIAKEAMKYQGFRDIVDCAHVYLNETNMSQRRYYINTNNLVSKLRYPNYFYDKATGIKTGSTSEAGNCLVSSAKDGDKEVIAVVLKANKTADSHTDSKNLLEYGFKNFKYVEIAKKGEMLGEVKLRQARNGKDFLTVSVADDVEVLLNKGADVSKIERKLELPEKVYAPISMGQEIGTAVYSYDGKEIARVSLVSETEVKRHPLGFLISFGEYIWHFKFVRIFVYVVLAIGAGFIAFIGWGLFRAIKKSKSKKRRASRYRPPQY